MKTRVEYNKFIDEHFITIPDDVVDFLKLEAGDIITWVVQETGIRLDKLTVGDVE